MSGAEHPFPWSEDAICRPPAENGLPPRRLTHDERVAPSTGTFYVSLPSLDWGPDRRLVHPPERVVQVSVINDVTCLTICKYDEDAGKSVSTTEVETVVSTQSLLAALVSQLDPDVADAALRMHARPIPPVERDCNGYALGSSCGCESSDDCPIPPESP